MSEDLLRQVLQGLGTHSLKSDRLLERLVAATNQNLELSGRLVQYIKSVDRTTDELLAVKRLLDEIGRERGMFTAALAQLNERLALINKDIDTIEGKVDDVTGSHRLATSSELDAPDPEPLKPLPHVHVGQLPFDPWYSRLLFRLLEAPARTQLLVIMLVLVGLVAAAVTSGDSILRLTPRYQRETVQGETKTIPVKEDAHGR